MTTLETLIAARELLSDPARWTKGQWARDKDGRMAKHEGAAVCFCAVGAIWSVVGGCAITEAETILCDVVQSTTRFTNIPGFSDHPKTTHAAVLKVFDAAIARARQS